MLKMDGDWTWSIKAIQRLSIDSIANNPARMSFSNDTTPSIALSGQVTLEWHLIIIRSAVSRPALNCSDYWNMFYKSMIRKMMKKCSLVIEIWKNEAVSTKTPFAAGDSLIAIDAAIAAEMRRISAVAALIEFRWFNLKYIWILYKSMIRKMLINGPV